MTNIDQFESAFKAADKPQYEYEEVDIRRVLVISDHGPDETAVETRQAATFLATLGDIEVQSANGDQFSKVSDLLAVVEEHKPDLICTYRNLHMPATDYPYSIGVFVEVLTQATSTPVLLLPRTDDQHPAPDAPDCVMAITDHLTGDHHLVSYAAKFTKPDGTLWLTHIEDQEVFERYMEAIGKISSIDTDDARITIMDRLLREPHDYVDSCRGGLDEHGLPLAIETKVVLGKQLIEYKQLIEKHDVELLVLNTKDDDQLAMHGLAYPLTVELRQTPMLLL